MDLILKDADVPAQKALWLASSAANGKTGLMLAVLTFGFMLRRLLSVGLRLMLRVPVAIMDLNISTAEPVLSVPGIYPRKS